jgi:hypothetical protein
MVDRRLLGAVAAALVLLPVAAFSQGTQLTPPGVRWGSGGVMVPAPGQMVGYDSSTSLPCIVGSTATCSLQTTPAGGGGGDASAANQATQITAANTTNTDLGPPGATACATDTGSCSLNALAQRIAQRLTSVITALGTPSQAATTGAAPPATGTYSAALGSGATGGLIAGLKTCDLTAKYDASDTGSITLVTGVASRKIYICGYILGTGNTATTLKLREGSDANCATNGADLTPGFQLIANAQTGVNSAFWSGLVTSTNGYYVCVNAGAANAHQAQIFYTIQ